MIFTERTIKMSNDACEIDNPIVLYRGDYNVEIRFTIIECPYKYSVKNATNIIEEVDASYGQLVIRVPNNGSPIFSDVVETKRGSVVFTLSAEMIDESIEVGDYTFQIRLFDANKESRATIPPVENGILIREPIAFEDVTTTNEVGEATVGYALTTAATQEDAFDSQGNYNKTTWGTGDRITAAKLNKIEAGIDGVNKKAASGGTGSGGVADSVDWSNVQNKPTIPTKTSQLTNDSGYITNIPDEYITEAELNAKGYATTSQIPVVPTNVSAFTNDVGYTTETFVTNKIAEAQLGGGSGGSGSVDLSGYVTKETGNANQITFADGQTFQAKLDNGILKGEKGDTGAAGQDGLTTAISVNGTTYTHSNGTITLPNYPTVSSGTSNIDDTNVTAITTYSSNKIENIKENLSSQIKGIENEMNIFNVKNNYLFDFSEQKRLVLNDFSGYNQPYHPSVIYIPTKFAGYKYWMVETPYPVNGQPYKDRWECPCVWKSNDGINWISVADPLDDLTEAEIATGDYFSDPHIVYRQDTKTLEVWYRLTNFGKEAELGKQTPTLIARKTTQDGINWTDREVLIDYMDQRVASFVRSPSVIWDNIQGIYRMWTSKLNYSYSYDGINWSENERITLNPAPTNNWHTDVNYYDNLYHLVSYNRDLDQLEHYTSNDGLNFTLDRVFLEKTSSALCAQHLYRSISLKDEFGNIRVYFTCESNNIAGIGVMAGANWDDLRIINGEKIIDGLKEVQTDISSVIDFSTGRNLNDIIKELQNAIYGSNSIVVDKNSINVYKGSYDTLNLKLNSKPSHDIDVYVRINNFNISIDKNILTFTPDNYNTYQPVTITAKNFESNTDVNYSLVLSSDGMDDIAVNVIVKNGEKPSGSSLYCDIDATCNFTNNLITDKMGNINFTATDVTVSDGAFNFNGSSSMMTSDTVYKNLMLTDNYTILIKVKSVDNGEVQGLIDCCNKANVGLGLFFRTTSPFFKSVGAAYSDDAVSTYGDGNPHIIVYSISNGKARIFIDGQFKSEVSHTITSPNWKDNMMIGKYQSGASTFKYLNGSLYNFRLYNAALSDNQIIEISTQLS